MELFTAFALVIGYGFIVVTSVVVIALYANLASKLLNRTLFNLAKSAENINWTIEFNRWREAQKTTPAQKKEES